MHRAPPGDDSPHSLPDRHCQNRGLKEETYSVKLLLLAWRDDQPHVRHGKYYSLVGLFKFLYGDIILLCYISKRLSSLHLMNLSPLRLDGLWLIITLTG